MSETPQEIVQRWAAGEEMYLDKVREAIRAVLEENEVRIGHPEHMLRAEILRLEAERDALLVTMEQQGVILKAQRARTEQAEAEVERLRAERAIIDRELRKSNLDATRWFIVNALTRFGGGAMSDAEKRC